MSVIGPEFQALVVQAAFGDGASGVMPATLWGAWLDGELGVIVETGIAVPQDAFGPTEVGVANTEIIDAGVAPASVPAFFALMDAGEGGQIVAALPVTFDSAPVEDDALAFAPGELTISYAEMLGG